MLSGDELIELEEFRLFIQNNPHLAVEYAIKYLEDYLVLKKKYEIEKVISQFLEARVNLLVKQSTAKGSSLG